MQITVTISDEVAAQVQADGMTAESFVERLIEDATRASSASAGRADLETFFGDMAADSDLVPQLTEESFTRESFYQDHD